MRTTSIPRRTKILKTKSEGYQPREKKDDAVLPLLMNAQTRAIAFGLGSSMFCIRKGTPIVNGDAEKSARKYVKQEYGFNAVNLAEVSHINYLPQEARHSCKRKDIARLLNDGKRVFVAYDTTQYVIVGTKRGRAVYSALFEVQFTNVCHR